MIAGFLLSFLRQKFGFEEGGECHGEDKAYNIPVLSPDVTQAQLAIGVVIGLFISQDFLYCLPPLNQLPTAG